MADIYVDFDIFVDPTYSADSLPETSPTGVPLKWQENAFNSISTNYVTAENGDRIIVNEGFTVYYNGFTITGSNQNFLHFARENYTLTNIDGSAAGAIWIYSDGYDDPSGEMNNQPCILTKPLVVRFDNVKTPSGDVNSGYFLVGWGNTTPM